MSEEWMKRIKHVLEELGYSFEAEESIRIHVGDVIVEVGASGNEYTVTVSIPLPPSSASSEEVEYYARLYEQGLKVLLGLGGEVRYEVDTSLPDYPALHMVRVYKDPNKLADELEKLLRKLAEEIPPSGGPAEG